MLLRLPKDSNLTLFKLALSEMFEAAIWLMFLPDPKGWVAMQDPSGKYHSVDRQGGYLNYTPAHFRLKRTLPTEIEKHLLDTFHPDLTGAETKNFREYYKEKKQPLGPYELRGPEGSRGYTWHVPDRPDLDAEDVASASYTAEETALANLQIHFMKMSKLMKEAEPYFSRIMNDHLL
jgi:hypothetical protein